MIDTLTLSRLVKAAKRCALNPSISDEAFLNAFLEPYIEAAKVMGKGGMDFHLDKHRTSKILKGAVDVPLDLRKVSLQHGLERRVARGCEILFDETIDVELFEHLKADILALLDKDEPRQAELQRKLDGVAEDPCRFLACAIVAAIRMPNKQEARTQIWKNGLGSICWQVGDLLSFGFGNRKKARNLIVIPVDTAFKTHVTMSYEGVAVEEVSAKTVHGQWIVRMGQSGVSEKDLEDRICRELERIGRNALAETQEWPIGTAVMIDEKKATYVLLAVAKFDSTGMARGNASDIEQALRSLFRLYDEKGQGADIYLPLIGAGRSRTGLSLKDSFDLIRKTATSGENYLGGKVTIVVRPEDIAELGLDS